MKVFAVIFLFASMAQAGIYKLDLAHSQVGFTVKHLMVTNVKGSFKKFEGQFNYDPTKKELKDIDVVIETESIETGVADRDGHLKGEDFFNAKKYPKITFKSQKGEIVIPIGKYQRCFTDTFKSYAVVALPKIGMVAIDRHQNILYEVFPFDNGPDNASEGLFRIVANKKIGYADAATGAVVIRPQFDCAFPFENGSAKVSIDCKAKSDGEHRKRRCIQNKNFYNK